MNAILGTILVLSGGLSAYFILEYLFFLSQPKETKGAYKKHILVLGSLIAGIILTWTMCQWQDGTAILITCTVQTAITYVFNKKNGGLFHWTVFFSAALLNISSAYGMVYSVCHGAGLLPSGNTDLASRVIIMGISLLFSGGIAIFLRYSGLFPNDSLKDILREPKKCVPLSIYLVMFCIGNVSTIYLMSPSLSTLRLNTLQVRGIYTDLFLKALIILAGGYLTVLYLCNLNRSENQSESLHSALSREKAFRVNLNSEDIATFCVDVDNDQFLEGKEFFDYMLAGETVLFSKAFQVMNQAFVHPDDIKKLEPYIKKETLLPYMKDTPIREEDARISRHAFELYTQSGEQEQKEDMANHSMSNGISDSEWIWISIRYCLSVDEDTKKSYLYISIRDINEHKKEELLMKENAERDALTGLFNRAYFEKNAAEQLEGSIEFGCIYMIDTDHLKQINDTFGHAEGDRMLINIASFLKEEFRSEDIIARIGGDEFVVFAPGLQDVSEIQRQADRLNQCGRRNYRTPDGAVLYTSISIGISFFPLHGKTLNELMVNADKALYSVKAASRDSYKIYA